MEKKKINELLKKVREDAGMTQKEACKNVMDGPSFSRMERGIRKIDFEQILQVLGNLSVSLEEFISAYVRPEIEENVRFYFSRLIKELPSDKAYIEIIDLFKELEKKYPELQFDELGVYFDIKTFFHKENPEVIPAITRKELDYILTRIRRSKRKSFFSEDYRLIGHTVMNMQKQEILELLDLLFPVKNTVFVTEQSKKFLNVFFSEYNNSYAKS